MCVWERDTELVFCFYLCLGSRDQTWIIRLEPQATILPKPSHQPHNIFFGSKLVNPFKRFECFLLLRNAFLWKSLAYRSYSKALCVHVGREVHTAHECVRRRPSECTCVHPCRNLRHKLRTEIISELHSLGSRPWGLPSDSCAEMTSAVVVNWFPGNAVSCVIITVT